MSADAAKIALNAIENASLVPISRASLPKLLASGEGEGSHVRALFGDVDLHTLLRLATEFGIDDLTLARAYAHARKTAAAANGELDEYVATYGV